MKFYRIILCVCLSVMFSMVSLFPTNLTAQTKPFSFLILPNDCSGQSSSSRTIPLKFNIPDSLQVIQKSNGIYFQMEDCSYVFHPGKPILPIITRNIDIQDNEIPSYILTKHVKAKRIVLQQDTLACAPEAKTFTDSFENSKLPFLKEENVQSKGLIGMSREEPVKEWVSIHEYSQVFPTMNVKHAITMDEQKKQLVLHIHPIYLYQGHVYLITELQLEVGLKSSDDEDRPDEKDNSSIILTPKELYEEAVALAKMQQEDGFETSIITLADVQSYPVAEDPSVSAGFSDAPEELRSSIQHYDTVLAGRIRSMLREKLQKDEVDYLTILGDASYIPPSYYEFSFDMLDDIDQWVPTDIYYSSPFYTDTLTFEVTVGRLPVQSKKEAQFQIDKMKRYREALAKPELWNSAIALFGGDPFRGDYFGELHQCRLINDDVFNGFSIDKKFQTSDLFTKEEFLSTLQEEFLTFVWNMGHGSGTAFMLEDDAVKGTDLLNLPQKNQLPVIVSEACGNGAWDTRFTTPSGKTHTSSFSEAVLASSGAGIAYVGGARVNYAGYRIKEDQYIQDVSDVAFMDAIVEYFFLASQEYPEECLGDWATKALEKYYILDIQTSYYLLPPHIKTLFGFTLLGDPTLRIPLPEEKPSYEVPTITLDEGLYPSLTGTTTSILSIDQKPNCEIETDSPSVQYIYAALEDEEKGVLSSDTLPPANQKIISTSLDFLQKAYATIRYSTEDSKEKRIVFDGRYDYDLSLQESYDLTLLRKNENRARVVEVKNEGIHPIKNASIEITSSSGEKIEKTFPYISRDFSENVIHEYQFPGNGEYTIQINVPVHSGETYSQDNQQTVTYHIQEKPICRVGILSSGEYYPSFAEGLLSLDKLNKQFASENQSIEVQIVELIHDSKGRTSYDLLGFDALVLFETFWMRADYNFILPDLEKFAQQGGKILGIHSSISGNEQMNMTNTSLQTFFGIRPEVFVADEINDEPNAEFQMSKPLLHSEKTSYQIENQYALIPKDEVLGQQKWNSSHLVDGAKIVGTGSQNGLALIQKNGNIFLFTGLMYNRYFTESSETFTLFHDLIQSLFHPTQNVSIGVVEAKNALSTIQAFKEALWCVEVVNHSSLPVNDLWLQVNDQEKLPVGTLEPHQRKVIETSLQSAQVGTCSHEFALMTGDQTLETLDQYSLRYIAQQPNPSEEDLSIVLDHWEEGKPLYAFGDSFMLSGKGFPGSHLRIGEQTIPVDQEGEFQAHIQPPDAPEFLRCYLEFDEVQGKTLKIPMKWYEPCDMYLHIGDSYIMTQGESKKIDSPPVILAGRTVVPISVIADGFGAKVEWEAKTQTIRIHYIDRSIKLQIGNSEATKVVDGEEKSIQLDSPPIIINGRTMVPLRFIAECFGAEIDWDGVSQVVSLKAYKPSSMKEEPTAFIRSTPSNQKTELFTAKADIPSYVLSCQETKDGLFVATRYGIHQYQGEDEISFTPYPANFPHQSLSFDPEDFSFAVHSDYFVVHNGNGVYRIHRQTQECDLLLSRFENHNLLVEKMNFYRIDGMLVRGDLLYVLCPLYGLMVYNVVTHEYLYTIGIDFGLSLACSDSHIAVYTLFEVLILINPEDFSFHQCRLENFFSYANVTFVDNTKLALYNLRDVEKWIPFSVSRILSNDTIDMEDWDEYSSFSRLRGDLVYIADGPSHYGILVEESGGSLEFTTEVLQMDFTGGKNINPLQEDISDCKRQKNWIPNPEGVKIIPQQNSYVCTQAEPGNPDQVMYTIEDRVVRHSLRSKANPIFSMLMGYAWSGESYSSLRLSIDYSEEEIKLIFLLDITDFQDEKPAYRKYYQIDVGDGDFAFATYTFTDDYLIVYDPFKNSLLWFDLSSEELAHRQFFALEDPASAPVYVSNLTVVNDVVYFIDSFNEDIFTVSVENGFTKIFDGSQYINSLQMNHLSIDGDTFYFHDSVSKNIFTCNKEGITGWISQDLLGASSIGDMDIHGNQILYLDPLEGNVCVQNLWMEESVVSSEEDISFSEDQIICEYYPGMQVNKQIGIYIDAPFTELQITSDEEVDIGEIKQKQSQVIQLSISPQEEKTIILKVIVDGIEKDLPIQCVQQEKFVTLYDQSIFADTWKGVVWSKNPCTIEEKRQYCWIDCMLMEAIFTCDISNKKDTYFLSFEDILLEAQLNENWYVYQNSEGQRYRRDGVLFQKDSRGNVFIEPTLYVTYAKGKIKRNPESVTISGL